MLSALDVESRRIVPIHFGTRSVFEVLNDDAFVLKDVYAPCPALDRV